MLLKKYSKIILLVLTSLWILFGIINVVYNSSKFVSEFKEWGYLSDGQKREKIFGNLHNFFTLIIDYTNNNNTVLIYSKDVKTFYLSKYYLYPRTVNSSDNMKEFTRQIKKGRYTILASDVPIQINGYALIASDSSELNSRIYIYKKK